MATSERDLLAQKATGAAEALEDAKKALQKLQDSEGGKREKYEGLKKELSKTKRNLAEGEEKVQVCVQ